MDIKKSLKDVLVLFVICCVFGTLLAAVNSITSKVIRDRENAPVDDSVLLEYLPGGSNFQELTIDDKYPSAVKKGWKADGGCVFQVEVSNWNNSGKIVIMVGIDSDGKIATVKHTSTNDTFGAEAGLDKDYTEKHDDINSLTQLPSAAASGAPKTTKAYYEALKAALQAAAIAGGEEVDTRTPEQILQDNCNAALGTTGLKFTKWFATEIVTGVDKVYVSSDNSSYVFIIGENFVGVNTSGVTTPDASDSDKAAASAAYDIIVASTTTEIAIPAGANTTLIKKIEVTASGNYVFHLEGQGYDYTFEYSDGQMAGNPKTISIKLSISKDGKIIELSTLDHAETKGIADKESLDKYCNSWTGAGSSDIIVTPGVPDHGSDLIPEGSTDLGAISSATYTSQGYQNAVKASFKAFELLTGGND